MTYTAIEDKSLLAAPKDADAPSSTLIVDVARKHGVSPIKQMQDMARLRFGPGKIAPSEYYSNGLYDPTQPIEKKREYVGRIGSWEINNRLSPPKLTETRAFLRDKVMYTALLDQLGYATTETLAVASRYRNFGNMQVLRSAESVIEFLSDPSIYPVFGKPCEGAASVGSVSLTGVENGQIVLGNGKAAPLEGFCAEIFEDYPEGFIFQKCLKQHPDLSAIAGDTVGTMRVVTVRDGDQPRVLYTVWKVPSPSAMSDNFWQAGSMVAQVSDDGIVGNCRAGTGLKGTWIDVHPTTGAQFAGVSVPYWDKVTEIANQAHGLFPEFGIIGWDIAVTPNGPVIIEANDNPYHVLWQLANGQGIHNAQFDPAFDRAAERSETILAGRIEMFKRRERAKGRKA